MPAPRPGSVAAREHARRSSRPGSTLPIDGQGDSNSASRLPEASIRRARLKVDVIPRYSRDTGRKVCATSHLRVRKRAEARAAATPRSARAGQRQDPRAASAAVIDPAARRARRRTPYAGDIADAQSRLAESVPALVQLDRAACTAPCDFASLGGPVRSTLRLPQVGVSPTTVGGQQSPTPPAPQSRLGTGARPVPNHADNGRNLRQSTSPRWVSRSPSTARFRGVRIRRFLVSTREAQFGERSDGPPRPPVRLGCSGHQ